MDVSSDIQVWWHGMGAVPPAERRVEQTHASATAPNPARQNADPYTAPPGAVPFADFLSANNRVAREEPTHSLAARSPDGDTFERTVDPSAWRWAGEFKPEHEGGLLGALRSKLWPKLSDVSPVTAPVHRTEVTTRQVIERHTGSGSMVDVTV